MTNIVFEQIPTSIRVPGRYTEYNTKNAVSALPNNKQRMLIVAPMTSGTVQALVATQVFSDSEALAYFGAGSWAHLMTKIAISNNELLDLTVIGLADDNAGVNATGTIAVVGTATGTGVATITICGEKYQSSFAKDDTSTTIAAALVAVISGSDDSPVVATANAGTITLTAKCAGEIGNSITVLASSTRSEITLSTAANLSNGLVNADIQTALDFVEAEKFDVICCPFIDNDNLSALSEHLEAQGSPISDKPGIGVAAFSGTFAQGVTLTEQLNDGRLTVAWYKGAAQSYALIAAGYAAVIAGEEDPARPLNTLEIKGVDVVATELRPGFTEQNLALYNGLTPLVVVNNQVQILRAISTYTKNASGTDDPSLLDITTIRTLDYVRDACQTRIALRFPREKLSEKTPGKVRSELLEVLFQLSDAEIIERVEENKGKLVLQRNANDPDRLDASVPADVVNGLHVFAEVINLYL